MKKLITLLALTGVLLTSCSSDEIPTDPTRSDERRINFTVKFSDAEYNRASAIIYNDKDFSSWRYYSSNNDVDYQKKEIVYYNFKDAKKGDVFKVQYTNLKDPNLIVHVDSNLDGKADYDIRVGNKTTFTIN